jgi:hypothetical protein
VRIPIRVAVLVLFACFGRAARADQVSCVANGEGVDQCVVYYPDVIHASVTYPGVQITAGDKITVTAAGCAQTGGTGKTWKRYLNPSGDKSDHLYHGLIQLPGAAAARIQNATGTMTAAASGPLVLGYEDDGYGDNGYWKHDDGTEDQCQNVYSTNHGRAYVSLTITHTTPPFAAAGTAYGQCVSAGTDKLACHIDRPDVTHATESYPAIQFLPGDQVVVTAQGCVQTGGSGKTWKLYVNPQGPDSGSHYHGQISIPGVTNGLVYLKNVVGQTLTATAGTLTLGYEDESGAYDDNGYWSHDDGTGNQCKGIGPASLDIAITHASMPSGTHVNLDGIEVVQSVQDMNQSVPLVAGKNTWVRIYLSGNVPLATMLSGTLLATHSNGQSVTLSPQADMVFATDALNARRARWTGSLNFLLPTSLNAAGTLTLSMQSVSANVNYGMRLIPCNLCSSSRAVTLTASPILRVRLVSVSYMGLVTATNTEQTFIPGTVDFSLLNSWLVRAYPTAGIETSSTSIVGKIKPPFPDDLTTCGHVDSQLSALRGDDISNTSVDKRTHYYGLVWDSRSLVNQGFMRGCSAQPDNPDPGATGSGPAGQGWPGDNDGSYADWYGGHEIGHTFGRKHPGYCNQTKEDPNFPFPDGFISDTQGSFVGLDFGDASVDTNTGRPITSNPPTPGSTPVPFALLPGTTTTEIMTYCPQPEWPSSYTFEAVRERIIAEGGNGSGEGGPSGGGQSSGATRSGQVVGTLDLTGETGEIEYVFPVEQTEEQPKSTRTVELLVLDGTGKELSRTTAAVRLLSDRKPEDHILALVNASVPADSQMTTIRLLIGTKSVAEFRSVYRKPQPPVAPKLEAPANESKQKPGAQSYRLSWQAPRETAASGPLMYTVEVSADERRWQTIGIGLKGTSLALTAEQSRMSLRITAQNGFLKSDPMVLKGRIVRGDLTPGRPR